MSKPYVTAENLREKSFEWMKLIEHRNVHKWPFDISVAALLVIDMQKYFLEEGTRPPREPKRLARRGGRGHGYCCGGVAVISNVKKLIGCFRAKKRPVIFTRHAHKKDGSDLGILGRWWAEMPVDGTPESEIDPRLNPPALKGANSSSPCGPALRRPGRRLGGVDEYIITKNRYSAFYNTNLDEILKKLGVKEVVISGVMTNICCESTARDAFFRDYVVRFVADATGSVKGEMHTATLLNLAYAFADICLTEELMGNL